MTSPDGTPDAAEPTVAAGSVDPRDREPADLDLRDGDPADPEVRDRAAGAGGTPDHEPSPDAVDRGVQDVPDSSVQDGGGDQGGDGDQGGNGDQEDPVDRRPERSVERVPDHDLVGALEAVLLVLDNPAPAADLAAAVGHTPQRVAAELRALAERYTVAGSGIELREISGGWRMWTRDRFAPIVERFILDGAQGRLSRAALESLAVVAYRQPVTRARVSAVRGVNVDGVFRTLTARGLIEEAGTDPDSSAILYRTTPLFLDRMGLSDLAELPSLGPLLPDVADLDAALDSDLDPV